MKILPFIIVIAAGIAGLYFTRSPEAGINPILGNESYHATYGRAVPSNLNEQERIRIHLAYVEELLTEKDVSYLSPKLQENRKKAITLLHNYWQNGQFPSNYDYPGERKPCFRDKDDQICAVGYLVQQTGHEDLVKSIEATENYSTIYEMTNSELVTWVKQSGLTLKECAMIQPTYGSPLESDPNYIPTGYAVSSSAITGIGLSTSLISLGNLKNPQKNGWIVPSIGIASGVSQITLGALNYNREFIGNPWINPYPSIHKRNQNLSMFNIAFGTFTTAFNTYALIQQLRGKKKRNDLSWNVFGYQSPSNDLTIGFNFVKRF
ncbi:MAG: hypothetical protein HRT58_19290 [Crocinitomicaceae bacterium]|nr:hypothetical protein [Flavobacteriales bacterium]NQZ37816.1 hypothetical protein [Crocinitomicaceae bacterium]